MITLNEPFNTSYIVGQSIPQATHSQKTKGVVCSQITKRNDEICFCGVRKLKNRVSKGVIAYNLYYVTLNIGLLNWKRVSNIGQNFPKRELNIIYFVVLKL